MPAACFPTSPGILGSPSSNRVPQKGGGPRALPWLLLEGPGSLQRGEPDRLWVTAERDDARLVGAGPLSPRPRLELAGSLGDTEPWACPRQEDFGVLFSEAVTPAGWGPPRLHSLAWGTVPEVAS